MNAEPFSIAVPDEVLADLRERLGRARLSPDFGDGWEYGTDRAYLEELLAHWRDEYDWRKHEAAMNAHPHFRVTIDDVPIHFLHERGKGPDPVPLVLTHGWPWTFWDLQKVIGPLTDPAAHGGDPADAFDVVIPSLPGFTFSTPLRKAGVNWWRTADLWRTLMQDVLGYQRFGAQGGDWGAFVSAQLGHKHADALIGVHLHLVAWLPLEAMPTGDYAPDEARWGERSAAFWATGAGYSAMMFTKPQTIGHALDDSPAGLASWIVEKRRDWADSRGDVERCFSKDDLCTTLTLFWVTRSAGSAARYYGEYARHPWEPSHDRTPVVQAPTGIAEFPQELFKPSRAWIEANYNLRRYEVMPAGGHFAPMEQPEALVSEIRAFFRELR